MNFKKLWLPQEKRNLPTSGNADPNLITFEVQNLNSFKIVFTSFRNNENPEWTRIECEPNKFCHLPHSYYHGYNAENFDYKGDIKIHKRFGDQRKTKCPYPVNTGLNTAEDFRKIKTHKEN